MAAPLRVSELARRLGCEVEGDADVVLAGVNALGHAGPGDLVFVRSPAHARALRDTKAAAVIAAVDIATGALPTLRSPNPGLDFARAARWLTPAPPVAPGVHPSAVVEPGAEVAEDASVGPGCVVGSGARIGSGSRLHARVTLYPGATVGRACTLHAGSVLREETCLGDRVVVHSGAVLGGEGFGLVADAEGHWHAMPQLGRVVVEDDVEIGALVSVDRAAFGETRIGRGTRLDALVRVGHGCEIGEDVLVHAQTGIAGSVRIGARAVLMPQCGIADHVRIGAGAYVGPRSGVTSSVADGESVLGSPHGPLRKQRRVWVAMRRLPDLLRRVRALERRLDGEKP